MHLAFQALLEDVGRALSPDAAQDLLERRGLHRENGPSYVTLGTGPAQAERSLETASAAYVVKKTAFDAVLEGASPAWFVWTQGRYRGAISPYRDDPPEQPTIWDEPDLLHPDVRALAVERSLTFVDRLTEDRTVLRQWVVLAPPRVIGVDGLLRASAWSAYAPSDVPGPRLWAEMLCLQAGGQVVFQGQAPNGACRLLAGDPALLQPFLHPYRTWIRDASPDLAGNWKPASAEAPVSPAPPGLPNDPMPDLSWKLWYEDLFDRETPRTVLEQGRGLVEGLTALWGRHLVDVPGGLSRYNLYADLGSIEITGDTAAQQALRIWIYGPRRLLERGYRQEADLSLLRKVARVHALRIHDRQRAAQLLELVKMSTDRFEFERRLDQLAEDDPAGDAVSK